MRPTMLSVARWVAFTAVAQTAPAVAAQPTPPPSTSQPATPSTTPPKPAATDPGAGDSTDLAGGGGFVLPTPPAQVLLDQVGAPFDTPSAPTDFAVSAGEIFGQDGSARAGGAVEIGLRVLGFTRRMSARDYLERPFARLVSRSYLSVATAAGLDDPTDVRMAVGWRSLLVDGADPYLSTAYRRAAEAAAADCDALRATDTPGWEKRLAACREKAYPLRAAALASPTWNAFGLVLSGGSSFGFPGGRTRSGGAEQAGAWLSAAWPLGATAQVGVGSGWNQSLVSAPHEASLSGLVRGGNRRARVSFEPGLVLEVPRPEAPEQALGTRIPLRLGGELLVDRNLWLSLGFGVSTDPDAGQLSLLSQGTLRWGQASQPSFGPG